MLGGAQALSVALHVEIPVHVFYISLTDANLEKQIQELNVSLASLQLECGMHYIDATLPIINAEYSAPEVQSKFSNLAGTHDFNYEV